jgi:uncharacterized protein YccT (UPF0319 family)
MSGTNDSEDEHLFTSQMLQSVSYTDIAMVLQDTTEPVDLLQVDGQHHPSAGICWFSQFFRKLFSQRFQD